MNLPSVRSHTPRTSFAQRAQGNNVSRTTGAVARDAGQGRARFGHGRTYKDAMIAVDVGEMWIEAARDADVVIGLAARRPLRAGAAVSARDVSAPQVIKAGELIVVNYQDGGISLSLQGKAMAAAGLGETVSVQNTTSKKIIQAVASGPGEAVVGPAAEQFRAARRTQLALR